MDRFDQEGEAGSGLFEPVLYPTGSEVTAWRDITGDASGAPPRQEQEASKYVAAWDAASEDVLGRYLDDIRRFDLLSADEEQALCWRIVRLRDAMERGESEVSDDPARRVVQRTGKCLQNQFEQAKSRMFYANLRLVIYVATRFRDRGVPLMDLIQEGNLGLLRAIEKFDPQRGVKFSTYAHWWIRQAISRAVAEQSRTVRVPSYVIDRQNKLRMERLRLWDRLDRPPDTQELSQALGWTRQEVESLRTVAQPLVWLHATATEDGRSLEELIEDPQAPTPGQRLEAEQLQQCLIHSLTLLPERQAFILRLRYGLETDQAHSLQEIASVMGLSRERVRQLEKSAFETLRDSPYGGVLADFINVS